MRSWIAIMLLPMMMPLPASAQAKPEVLEATTRSGDAVRLLPNGRWEYVDPQKQAQAQAVAETYPENRVRPVDAQGGFFGFGRLIMPGDPDYNRGTLNPKFR